MKRIVILAACLLITALTLTACGSGSDTESTQAAGGDFFDESTSEAEPITFAPNESEPATEEAVPAETTP